MTDGRPRILDGRRNPDATRLQPVLRRVLTGVGLVAILGVAAGTAQADVLTVMVVGPGTGTVTSSPPGISCPETCRAEFPPGAEVTLTATPDPGQRLDSWSGICGGAAPTCTVTSRSHLLAIAGFRAADDPHSILHHFGPAVLDGCHPDGGQLVFDGEWLFGMASSGGPDRGEIIFRVRPNGSGFEVLHSITGSNTKVVSPDASLVLDGDALYGASRHGGDFGHGVLFSIRQDGSDFTVLHSLSSFRIGAPVLRDDVLYGMAGSTIYSIRTDGTEFRTLHTFSSAPTNGTLPVGSLVVDAGDLYGMTYAGGSHGEGTVFSIRTDGSGFQLLHSFSSSTFDGRRPNGTPVLDAGVLYGTTSLGGSSDDGTVFSLNIDGSGFRLVHSFSAYEGHPFDSLIIDNGVLYGMTPVGGPVDCSDGGTVFSVNSDGSEFTQLHAFGCSATDGRGPHGSLLLIDDALYGTTRLGGTNGDGTVFSISTDGSAVEVLHSFSNQVSGGRLPLGSLVLDANVLYGTSSSSDGIGAGTVFSIRTDGSEFTLLHEFSDAASDGASPCGRLLVNRNALYGMTADGGLAGWGTVFSMNTDGTDFRVLHSFVAYGIDGHSPRGSLVHDGGVLYGMTSRGGSVDPFFLGFGTAFSISTDGTDYFRTHVFSPTPSPSDGSVPYGSPVFDNGVLYGMSLYGGAFNPGAVFSMSPDGSEFTILHSFSGSVDDGASPWGDLLLDSDVLYGMTSQGGAANMGTIFSMTTDGAVFNVLHSFSGSLADGALPEGSLTLARGTLYGTTRFGGGSQQGLLFSINPDGSDFRPLHSFDESSGDGAYPRYSRPVVTEEFVYGMTSEGGATGSGVIYAHHLPRDTAPPENPVIESTDPAVSTWSTDATVELTFGGAHDDTAVAGYSILFDGSPASEPDETLEVAHVADPHAFTSPALGDGDSWYAHLRTCDVVGNCAAAIHAGPFWIDLSPPGAPEDLASPSHTVGDASPDPTVEVQWIPVTDPHSGTAGYAWAFGTDDSWSCDGVVDGAAAAAVSEPLPAGTWWFHVCAVDGVGHTSAVADLGPFVIDPMPIFGDDFESGSTVAWSSITGG